eukprot:TRINITY_DN11786_c0_g1_i1.p1 TRINITY_DN11786_c0_g1~~TRINITY_DN11786_c0_g1_i1.p1  ORF type:complete len:375 (-),score=64.22 TRINITY_DN11786_c0_g1_i1:119-1243(-)
MSLPSVVLPLHGLRRGRSEAADDPPPSLSQTAVFDMSAWDAADDDLMAIYEDGDWQAAAPSGPAAAARQAQDLWTVQHMQRCLRRLRKLPEAEPFLAPLPWEELGLDDYLEVVEHPIDLQTIGKRLDCDAYWSAELDMIDPVLFWDDLMRCWQNCLVYYEGDEDCPAYQMAEDMHTAAGALQEDFWWRLQEYRRGLTPHAAERSSSIKSPRGAAELVQQLSAVADKKKVSRESTEAVQGPSKKRSTLQVPSSHASRSKPNQAVTEWCTSKLQEVLDKLRRANSAEPFLATATMWKELGLNDYPTVVLDPLDLQTIARRLQEGLQAFEVDLVYGYPVLFPRGICRTRRYLVSSTLWTLASLISLLHSTHAFSWLA